CPHPRFDLSISRTLDLKDAGGDTRATKRRLAVPSFRLHRAERRVGQERTAFINSAPAGAASGPVQREPSATRGRVLPEGIPDAAPTGAGRFSFPNFTHGCAVGYTTAPALRAGGWPQRLSWCLWAQDLPLLFQTVARVSPPAIRSLSQGRGWGHPRYKKTARRPLVPHSPCGTPGRPSPASRDCIRPFERPLRLCGLEVATVNSPRELTVGSSSWETPTGTRALWPADRCRVRGVAYLPTKMS